MKQFTVTQIDRHENETQIHMVSDNGDTLRFFAGEKAWTFRAFSTGRITKKQLEKIIDIWYMLENKCKVSIGDKVTV